MNTFERLGDIKLPNQQKFFRKLNDKDCEHALKILSNSEKKNYGWKWKFVFKDWSFVVSRRFCKI